MCSKKTAACLDSGAASLQERPRWSTACCLCASTGRQRPQPCLSCSCCGPAYWQQNCKTKTETMCCLRGCWKSASRARVYNEVKRNVWRLKRGDTLMMNPTHPPPPPPPPPPPSLHQHLQSIICPVSAMFSSTEPKPGFIQAFRVFRSAAVKTPKPLRVTSHETHD